MGESGNEATVSQSGFLGRTNVSIVRMVPLYDKLSSATVTVFSKLLSTFADNRVASVV